MTYQPSPAAQKLLDKMKPLGQEIQRLDEIEKRNRIGGTFEKYRDARDEKQRLIKKFGGLQSKYRRLRAKENGEELLS